MNDMRKLIKLVESAEQNDKQVLQESFVDDFAAFIQKKVYELTNKIPSVRKARFDAEVAESFNHFQETMTDEKIAKWKEQMRATVKSEHPSSRKMFERGFSDVLNWIKEVKNSENSEDFMWNMADLNTAAKDLRNSIRQSNRRLKNKR